MSILDLKAYQVHIPKDPQPAPGVLKESPQAYMNQEFLCSVVATWLNGVGFGLTMAAHPSSLIVMGMTGVETIHLMCDDEDAIKIIQNQLERYGVKIEEQRV